MKRLFLSVALITISALSADADPSIKQVEAFIQSWLKSPEAANFGGHNAWFWIKHDVGSGGTLLQWPFGIWLYAPADDPFLDPKALVAALDQALSLKFDGFFSSKSTFLIHGLTYSITHVY